MFWTDKQTMIRSTSRLTGFIKYIKYHCTKNTYIDLNQQN